MKLKSLNDLDLDERRVLVRVDFNVPLADGKVTDDTRIAAALPTITELVRRGAKIILCSHLGRPKGQVVEEARLDPVAAALNSLLTAALDKEGLGPVQVAKLGDCVGPGVEEFCANMNADDVVLLENLRFHAGEEANDPNFAKQLAALADVYVNDAFGAAHRAHASTEGVAHLLPAAAGLLVQQEVAALSQVTGNPKRPLTVVLGGAKISGKIEVLESMIPLADSVLVGGAMANTFFKARGLEVGASLVEDSMLDTANRMLELGRQHSTEILLPSDCVVTDDVKQPTRTEIKPVDSLARADSIADIGPATSQAFGAVIGDAGTVFWNGPMGVFENEAFANGTMAVAWAMAAAKTAHTVVGGGESVSAVNRAGVADKLSHVSTGGGASLEFIAGMELPGLTVLAV